ncbi:MAG TPA: ROK family transcriptional regulator [Actinomycetota bacterium]|nr:ROK family transcriptional regulator [Actinomycetota bacterium]
MSGADIARCTGLAPSTVTNLVAELGRAGLVEKKLPEPRATGRPLPGRPSAVVALSREVGVAVGVDIGHTKIQVAVGDSSGEVLSEPWLTRDVDAYRQEVAEVLDLAASLVRRALKAAGIPPDQVRGIAIGVPAPVNKETHLMASDRILPTWRGLSKPVTVTMADLLERYLGRRLPVFLDNDANLCLLAEVARGVARGREHVMFVKASVGIGLALFLDGKLYRGSTGAAGQFGHTPVAVHLGDGAAGAAAGTPPRCSTCGRVGCLEVFASARALVEQLRPLPSLTFGRDFTPADVVGMTIEEVDLALGGKRAEAQAAIREAGRQLGIAIGGLINVLDPQMVVIGGVLARAGDLILEPIRNEVRERAVRVRPEQVEVVESQLRERAEVHGGIALALAETSALRSLSVPQPPRPAR